MPAALRCCARSTSPARRIVVDAIPGLLDDPA